MASLNELGRHVVGYDAQAVHGVRKMTRNLRRRSGAPRQLMRGKSFGSKGVAIKLVPFATVDKSLESGRLTGVDPRDGTPCRYAPDSVVEEG
jgi:hypothetical protein